MKTILFIACACIVSVAAIDDNAVEYVAAQFVIGKEEAQDCINKTKATEKDFDALDMLLPIMRNELLKINETLRASCAFACAAQARGLMIGSKLQLDKIIDFVNKDLNVPDDIRIRMSNNVKTCYGATEESDDECAVGLQFFPCL